MNKKKFEGLLESVRDGGRILRGEQPPSRMFIFEDDVRREATAEEIKEFMQRQQKNAKKGSHDSRP